MSYRIALTILSFLGLGCSGLRTQFDEAAPSDGGNGHYSPDVDGGTITWEVEWFEAPSFVGRFQALCAFSDVEAAALPIGSVDKLYHWKQGQFSNLFLPIIPNITNSSTLCLYDKDGSLILANQDVVSVCRHAPCEPDAWELSPFLIRPSLLTDACIHESSLLLVGPSYPRQLLRWTNDGGYDEVSLPVEQLSQDCSVAENGDLLVTGSEKPLWLKSNGTFEIETWGGGSVSVGPARRASAHLQTYSVAVGDGRIVHLREASGQWNLIPVPSTPTGATLPTRPAWATVAPVSDEGFLLGGETENGYSLGWLSIENQTIEWLETLRGHRIYGLAVAGQDSAWAAAVEESTTRAGLVRLRRKLD